MPDKITAYEGMAWAFASTAAAVLGWRGVLALVWIGSMVLDYLTGTAAAARKGEWNSGKAREGLFHKGGMLAVVGAAVLLDLLLRTVQQTGVVSFPFIYKAVLMPVTMAGFAVTEIGVGVK